jgi:hypothetical protein
VSDTPLAVEEVTELAGEQARVRELVVAAFRERLGDIAVECHFHRGWNGGWRCRALATGKPPLEFALLRAGTEVIAFPVPFPPGWRTRGVAGSAGGRYAPAESGEIVRVPAPR